MMHTDIAIIGMAGRFPGAPDVETLWRNLCDGKEAVRPVTEGEMLSAGVDPVTCKHPNFVKAASFLDGVEWFDAPFFGISAREAEIMDPQQRVFLECAWEALESAGYARNGGTRSIGVYCGATMNTYLICNLLKNPEAIQSLPLPQLNLGNSPDFLATRVSYKLNLTGPSQTIQSACSTSLVAVHHACQGILRGECQMAMAGGVSVNLKLRYGYDYLEGGMVSPDGHCRPFDQDAQGTIFASGVGIVVLKKLEAALRDGDFIHAVVKGSAINNDGSLKVGFTAPSIQGQASVIIEALASAGVAPDTIQYVEAHGTGTPLGDPIEVQALSSAFRTASAGKACCALGSIKSNLGHLDAAAGITGLIKTALALKHRLIPATLHFHKPNPAMELEGSPFYINTELREWESPAGPRRAGVSSFGVGGTNAHVVLEEAPPRAGKDKPERDWELLLLSARSQSALEQMTRNLGEHLNRHGREAELANVAYTLQVGRKQFPYRRFALCRDLPQGVEALLGHDHARSCVYSQREERENRPVVFLFPGQGSQYAGMGRELYQGEKVFRGEVDRCAESVREELGLDLREVLLGGAEWSEELQQTWLTQPALFVVEYALARQWMSWGVKPEAMLGHSVGEYVAGCVAGVFSVEEGLRLVVRRARLMQKQRPGKMLAVGLSESEAGEVLGEGVWLGAVNGPMQVVLSGEAEALRKMAAKLEEEGVSCRWLETSHAFHSGMMEGMLGEFLEEVKQVRLKDPEVPFISNVSGKWIKGEEARDAGYWARHVREPVRFGEGIRELLQDPQRVFLEVGPRQTLTRLAKQQRHGGEQPQFLPGLPEKSDTDALALLGQLWLTGAAIDWTTFHSGQSLCRLPLPTYPFERQRYWVEPNTNASVQARANAMPSAKPQIEDAATTLPQLSEPVRTNSPQTHQRPVLKTQYVPPGNEVEVRITEICQRILGITPIGIDDNFFELGGDSLIALQLVAEMKEKLAANIPIAGLYEHLTIRSLAAMLKQKSPTENGADSKTRRAEAMHNRRQYQQMERDRRAVKK